MIKKFCKKLDNNINKIAVLIGISYKNTPLEMSDQYDDLNRIILYLLNIGYNTNDIILLTDCVYFNNRIEPTYINIITELMRIVNIANSHDKEDSNNKFYIFFYYTGHGTREIHNNKIIEVIIPVDYNTNSITGQILLDCFITNLSNNVIVFIIIDCCYSGNIIPIKYKYTNKKKVICNKVNNNSIKCNVFILSSSSNKEVSLKTLISLSKYNKRKVSLLTWAFCEKYKMNATLYGLITNIQKFMDIKFKGTQTVQLLSNIDFDGYNIAIPILQ